MAKAEREVAKVKKEIETLQGKLDQKRVEADSLRLWKVRCDASMSTAGPSGS